MSKIILLNGHHDDQVRKNFREIYSILYPYLYCTKSNNFSLKCIKIAGGCASANEAQPWSQLEELIRLHLLVPRLSCFRRKLREERKIWVVWSLGAGWQIVSKTSPVLMNHFNHCRVCVQGLWGYISNFLLFPPRLLRFLGVLHPQ